MIDLHLHFDGSITPAIARKLMALDAHDVREISDELLHDLLIAGADCRDLNEYLGKFDFPLSLLQTPEQVEACVRLVREDLANRGIESAELRFAPQSLGSKGQSQQEAVEAAISGLSGAGAQASIMLCCMRGASNHAENRETLRLAKQFLGLGVCAADLAGAEALFPTSDFADLFAYARELELPFTIHAGEAAGPESVAAALSFGAKRIGHGVRAAEDPALLEELAKRGTTLELCPTSELNTGVFASYEDIPLRTLLDAGVAVTINSDNMAVSDTDVVQEFAHMQEVFGLTPAELQQLEENALAARF